MKVTFFNRIFILEAYIFSRCLKNWIFMQKNCMRSTFY